MEESARCLWCKVSGLLQVSFPLSLLDRVAPTMGREGGFALTSVVFPWSPKFGETPLLSSCVTLGKIGSSLCICFLIFPPHRVIGHVNISHYFIGVFSFTISMAYGIVMLFLLSSGPSLLRSLTLSRAGCQSSAS